MVFTCKVQLPAYLLLQFFKSFRIKLYDFSAIDADHMIVVFTAMAIP